MFSKFLRPPYIQVLQAPFRFSSRSLSLLPKDQYTMPTPDRLKLGYVLRVYWETIPLFFVTAACMTLVASATLYSIKNKVDCTYTIRTRDCISRTMDLRHPTIHKVFTINQEYPPWDQMQDVLDKMKQAEKRALARAESCAIP